MGLQERGAVSKVVVQIWFDGDVGAASIEYVKTFKGDPETAHNRFLKNAQRQFPNCYRIKVKTL